MKLLVAALLCLISTTLLVAQEQAPKELRTTSAVEADQANWKTFSSTDGRFSVDFPGAPNLSSEEAQTSSGKFVVNKCNVTTLAEYGVMYSDFPMKIDGPDAANQILDNGAKGAVTQVKARLLSISNITVDNYPGRLLKEQMRDGSTMYAKMILVGQRLYQVAATTPTPAKINDKQRAVYEAAAQKFLDSFKLLPAESAVGEVDTWLRDHPGQAVMSLCLEGNCESSSEDQAVIIYNFVPH